MSFLFDNRCQKWVIQGQCKMDRQNDESGLCYYHRKVRAGLIGVEGYDIADDLE